MLIYLAFVVVIILALAGVLDLRYTVIACLVLHFAGLLWTRFNEDRWYTAQYLDEWQVQFIGVWDVVQLGLLVATVADDTVQVAQAAANAALWGFAMCYYKYTHHFKRVPRASIYRKTIILVFFAVSAVATAWALSRRRYDLWNCRMVRPSTNSPTSGSLVLMTATRAA